MNGSQVRSEMVFNTSLEVGLRCLVLLSEMEDMSCDIQRLIYYDYLLIHYGDVDEAYESLHPATPHRSGEILVKRQLVANGLNQMSQKKLTDIQFSENGISYKSSRYTKPFLSHFESVYLKDLRMFAKLVIDKFSAYNDIELRDYMFANIDQWGGEFSKEAFFRGDIHE